MCLYIWCACVPLVVSVLGQCGCSPHQVKMPRSLTSLFPPPDAFCASQVHNKCSNAISFVQDTNPPISPSYQQGDHLVKGPGNGAGIITSVNFTKPSKALMFLEEK